MVSNGQLANQNTFNTSFVSREVDTNTVGKLDLLNADSVSGPNLINTQKIINSIASSLGITTSEVYDYIFPWVVSYIGTSNDTVIDRVEAIATLFNGLTGHNHDATDGNGAAISALALLNINKFSAHRQKIDKTGASGTSIDISTEMSGKVPGGTSTLAGVITSAPNNRVYLKDMVSETFLEDGEGQRIYGRITESGGAWTLSFYTIESGVETAHSLSSTDVSVYFWEVFTIETRPTIPSDPAEFGTLDITSDVVDASATTRGLVNLLAQSFTGKKTFLDGLKISKGLEVAATSDNTTTGANATIATAEKMLHNLVNASLTSVDFITDVANEKMLILSNATGSDITITNDAGANGIITGTTFDLVLKDDASILLIYDSSISKWKIIGGAGGGGGVGFQETPSGTVDGVNDSFGPLTYAPSSDESVTVFIDGIAQVYGTDWNISGSTITMTTPPALGQNVYVFYLTQGNPSLPSFSGVMRTEFRTISGGEETAKQLTLAYTPATPSYVLVDVIGGGAQVFGTDYTISSNIFDWSGYSLDGVLSAGDIVRFNYVT